MAELTPPYAFWQSVKLIRNECIGDQCTSGVEDHVKVQMGVISDEVRPIKNSVQEVCYRGESYQALQDIIHNIAENISDSYSVAIPDNCLLLYTIVDAWSLRHQTLTPDHPFF